MRKIIVSEELFEKFPNFKRGLIIVEDIDNILENQEIGNMLDKEIESKKDSDISNNSFILAWDEVHRRFSSNPNKFPPSIKSLLKRIKKGGFPFINSVVALFNYISVKYEIPCGGDDVEKIEGNLKLDFARGDEKFIGLGNVENEPPIFGEVIYFDDATNNVMCRKWNWRNGSDTKIIEKSKKIVINIDGIGPVSKALIEEARDELAKLLIEKCNAKLTTNYIDKDSREVEIEI